MVVFDGVSVFIFKSAIILVKKCGVELFLELEYLDL